MVEQQPFDIEQRLDAGLPEFRQAPVKPIAGVKCAHMSEIAEAFDFGDEVGLTDGIMGIVYSAIDKSEAIVFEVFWLGQGN